MYVVIVYQLSNGANWGCEDIEFLDEGVVVFDKDDEFGCSDFPRRLLIKASFE